MVSEMGNTNSSTDQEAEKAAGNANGVKEDNNIIPEGERKENQVENSEDDKTDENKIETQLNHTFQCSEVQTDSNDSVSEVTNTETQISPRKDELHDQPFNQKGEAEGDSSNDEVLKSDPVESSSVSTETVEECYILPSGEEQDTPVKGKTDQNEDKTQMIISEISVGHQSVVSDADDQNGTTRIDDSLSGEMADENQVENGSSVRGDLDETSKVEPSQSDATGSLLVDSPQITPSSSFAAVLDPEDKCMVHISEAELISNESEDAVNKCDLKETESLFMQAVHEMQIESHSIGATEEKLPGNNPNADSVMDYSIEADKARRDYDPPPSVEQDMNSEEIFEMVPEIGLLPTEFIGAASNLEEESSKENGFLEKEKEEDEKSSRKEIMEEGILHLGSSKPENGVDIAYADGRMQEFESVEDQKERNADLTEHDICEFVVTEDSGVFELNISEKEIAKTAHFAEIKNAQDVQPSLDRLTYSSGKCAFDQMVPKSTERVSLESIPEKSSNGTELRKCPSFDFGVHRRSLESDQTPLLCPEKTPTRSLSVGSNAKFSNSTMRTEYNRSLLDYEAVAVEEKTIQVERSDSDISKAPLLGFSSKGENGDLKVTSETQQNHVADLKGDDLQASQEKETSLTSANGSGKRKPRPSFFTTCICCTAATHY